MDPAKEKRLVADRLNRPTTERSSPPAYLCTCPHTYTLLPPSLPLSLCVFVHLLLSLCVCLCGGKEATGRTSPSNSHSNSNKHTHTQTDIDLWQTQITRNKSFGLLRRLHQWHCTSNHDGWGDKEETRLGQVPEPSKGTYQQE